MRKALVIWFFVAALVAMGCSPPPDNSDSFGSVGTLQDSNSWIEIWDWYDLHDVRNDLSGSYVLMRDLDAAAAGYDELAGPAANDGKGWHPIGRDWGDAFRGRFDGQGHEVRDLSSARPAEDLVGLFGYSRGYIEDLGVVNASLSGFSNVGLVGYNNGIVRNSHFSGSVTGNAYVGGIVGLNYGTVQNSYYNYQEVLINGENIITVGALFSVDFEEWLARNKFLGVNERLSEEDGYYLIHDTDDLKQLLAFGQHESLRFRLKNDLDLGDEPDLYIPYMAGKFHGNGHKISNLSFSYGFVSRVGLFGYLHHYGEVTQVGIENVNITGDSRIGGLVGESLGTVSDSYSTGAVTGHWYFVGGLVGLNWGEVSNSNSTATVSNHWSGAGGLVGENAGIVTNCFFMGSVTGHSTIGGLAGTNSGTITNSYSSAAVSGGSFVGGLVGRNGGGDVRQSYSTGTVTSEWYFVGGLVGGSDGTVSHCYSTSNVSGGGEVGGLIGRNEGDVSQSYSIGTATAKWQYVGGLVGRNSGIVSNSFWDVEASGTDSSDGGTGRTTAEMKDIQTFLAAEWEIEPTTEADPTDGYPFLAWQLGGSPTWYISGIPAVTTKTATDTSTDSATLNMSFTVGDYSPVEVRFSWREDGDIDWITAAWIEKADSGTHAETLIGLDADTAYEFKAQLNYNSAVIDGAVLTFTTEEVISTESVETATGTGTAFFTTSHGVIEDLKAVPPHSLPSVLFPHGMFDFRITGLTPGQTVTLTIEFPSPLPIGTLWWKYDNGRWYALPNESDNGDHIMVISLTDGGVHDLDDVPGQITDPGGPGNPMTVGWDGSPVSKSVVLWPWIAFLAAIMAGASLLMLRRRNRGQDYI